MVYHAVDAIDDEGRNRKARVQKMGWEMNAPKFPIARGRDIDLEVPSGQ